MGSALNNTVGGGFVAPAPLDGGDVKILERIGLPQNGKGFPPASGPVYTMGNHCLDYRSEYPVHLLYPTIRVEIFFGVATFIPCAGGRLPIAAK
jgi:hypothetical protein